MKTRHLVLLAAAVAVPLATGAHAQPQLRDRPVGGPPAVRNPAAAPVITATATVTATPPPAAAAAPTASPATPATGTGTGTKGVTTTPGGKAQADTSGLSQFESAL